MSNVQCAGSESSLLDCLSSGIRLQRGCRHSQDAGVYCTGQPQRGEGGGEGRGERGGEGGEGRGGRDLLLILH